LNLCVRLPSGRKLLAWTLATLCLLELGLRYGLGLGTPVLMMSHPTIEYLPRPNQNVRRFGARVHYNEYSMRSPSFSEEKGDPREYRVLMLGDSVINGGSTLDQDELASSLIASELAKSWHRPVLVMNASAGSWGPQNQLAYLDEFGTFDCDAAILVWSSHDLDDVPTFAPLSPFTHPTQDPPGALYEAIFRYFLPLLERRGTAETFSAPQGRRAIPQMEALLRRFDVPVLVLFHLTRPELESGSSAVTIVSELSRLNGADFSSLGPSFRRALSEGGKPYRKGDPIHPTFEGQRLIAESAVGWLRSRPGRFEAGEGASVR
jgi:hypothetical protein